LPSGLEDWSRAKKAADPVAQLTSKTLRCMLIMICGDPWERALGTFALIVIGKECRQAAGAGIFTNIGVDTRCAALR